MHRSLLLLFTLALLCTACQITASAKNPASQALQAYLEALTRKDETTLTLLSCADWELNALLELDAFQSVETSLEGLSCQPIESDESSASVVCQGKIVASYFAEDQEFDLSERTYQLVEQNGDWLVCGYLLNDT